MEGSAGQGVMSRELVAFSDRVVERRLLALMVFGVAFPLRYNVSIGPFSSVSLMDLCMLPCFLFLIVKFLISGKLNVSGRLIAICLLIPVVIAFFSLGWTLDIKASSKVVVIYFYAFCSYLCALYYTRNCGRSEILRIIGIMLVCWFLGSVFMYLGVPGFQMFIPESYDRTAADIMDAAATYMRFRHPSIGQCNDYAPVLAFVGFVMLGAWAVYRKKMYASLSGLAFMCVLLTMSRGVILATVFSLGVFIFVARLNARTWMKLAMFGVVILVFIGMAVSKMNVQLADRTVTAESLVEDRSDAYSVDARVERNVENFQMVIEKPLIGYGAGIYEPVEGGGEAAAHNTYLEQWKFYGILLGTISSLCIFLILFQLGYGLGRGSFLNRPLVAGVTCGWLCLMISALTQTFFEASVPRALLYFLLGCGINLLRSSVPAPVYGAREECEMNPSINIQMA